VAVELADEGDWLVLAVVDNGVGMSEEQLAHLFEPFNRLGRERGTVEGTGIGLHLTRQLVLRMGGTIAAESRLGEGTRVSLRLPRFHASGEAAPAEAAAVPAASAAEALAGPILYIEDNPVNLMLVEQFLARWPEVRLSSADYRPRRAGAAARMSASTSCCSTCSLPDMHGTELLQQLAQPGGAGAARRWWPCRPARCRGDPRGARRRRRGVLDQAAEPRAAGRRSAALPARS
jgi:hypothetical protein